MPQPLISSQQVLHIARLARLELDQAELASMTMQLGAILEYVGRLNEIDTTGVEPTTQGGSAGMPLREDIVQKGVDRSEALAQSPHPAHDGFAVPGFIED